MPRMKVAVLGAGAWGTALAGHLAARHDTVLWARDSALVADLSTTQQNARYLAGVSLPPALRYEADLPAALAHCAADDALCVVATPVAGLRGLFRAMRDAGSVPAHVVWLCKGFEADTQLLPHQVVAAELAGHTSNGVLSGPSFAREVGQGLPVALTVASGAAACRERTVAAFHHGAMRIYTGDDLVGVEVGGAVKNVLAIATGISDGLGLGLNARAALITRCRLGHVEPFLLTHHETYYSSERHRVTSRRGILQGPSIAEYIARVSAFIPDGLPIEIEGSRIQPFGSRPQFIGETDVGAVCMDAGRTYYAL